MPRAMLTTVIATLGIYLAFLTLVYLGQSGLLYLPDAAGRGLVATPAAIGLPYEDVHLRTEDGLDAVPGAGLGETHGAVEAVMVGEGQGRFRIV